jgi:DNA-binding response OmpR family regulator
MVKSAPRFDQIQWLTLHDAAAHEAFGYEQGKSSLPSEPVDEVVTIGRLVVNFWEHTIFQQDKTIQLYDKQWALFVYLLGHFQTNQNRFIPKDQLLHDVWGGTGSRNLVNITIWRLRSKLESINADVMIESVHRTSRYRLRVRKIKV